jgi:hypothetical protein
MDSAERADTLPVFHHHPYMYSVVLTIRNDILAFLIWRTKRASYHVHCTKNLIYVFPEKELRDLSPNSVSVRNLYIPRISPHIGALQNRQTNP